MSRFLLACAVSLSLPAAAFAAEKLNVKTGLWEIKSTIHMSGIPPLPAELLAKMTPEQRKKMEADMRAAQSKEPHTETENECITEKDLERPFQSASQEDCEQSIVNSTRTSQEARLVCKGKVPATGSLKINTPSPERMNGLLDLKTGSGPDAFVIKGQLQGRWIGSDCGDEADDEETYDDEESYDDEEETSEE